MPSLSDCPSCILLLDQALVELHKRDTGEKTLWVRVRCTLCGERQVVRGEQNGIVIETQPAKISSEIAAAYRLGGLGEARSMIVAK